MARARSGLDDRLHQMIYTKRLLAGPDDKRLGILTVLTDVTELEQARFAAQEAQTRLTQITDSMPGLVYQVSLAWSRVRGTSSARRGPGDGGGSKRSRSAWRSPVSPSWG